MTAYNPQAAAERAGKNYRNVTAQLGHLGLETAIPEAVRALAEKTVGQSREAYDRSRSSHAKEIPRCSIQFLKFAAAGALVALTATSTPARADEMVQTLGPVGPNEPILTTVGSKRVIAFYVPGRGGCVINAVVWEGDDTDANTAMRIRVSLNPGQNAYIDGAENKSLSLRCGDDAGSLTEQHVASE
jgi:hypothetical protein